MQARKGLAGDASHRALCGPDIRADAVHDRGVVFSSPPTFHGVSGLPGKLAQFCTRLASLSRVYAHTLSSEGSAARLQVITVLWPARKAPYWAERYIVPAMIEPQPA